MDSRNRRFKNEYRAWKSIYATTGQKPDIVYSHADVPKWPAALSKTFTQEQDPAVDTVDKIEVGLQRTVSIPGEPCVFDQVFRVRGMKTEIVRIEQFDYGCSATFIIDKNLNCLYPSKSNLIYRLSISQLDSQTQKERVLKDVPIREPLAFFDKSAKGEKTCLYQGSSGEIFWFSLTNNQTVSLNLLEANSEEPEERLISQNSQLREHVMQPRYFKDGKKFRYKYATAVPRMLTIYKTKLVVFSQHQEEGEPAVLFYDLEKKREVVCVKNAEMYLLNFDEKSAPHISDVVFWAGTSKAEKGSQKIRTGAAQPTRPSGRETGGDDFKDMKQLTINFAEGQKGNQMKVYDLNEDMRAIDSTLP